MAPSLMRVRTEVMLDVMVPSLHEAAAERADGSFESLGWHARAVELERFAPARAPISWLSDLLAAAEDAEAVIAGLVAAEPEGRPEPPDAPSWRVPGPGGHVRYYVSLLATRSADDRAAARRAWLTGFFRHCCEEAPDRGPATGA